jgi:hypothetical protein
MLKLGWPVTGNIDFYIPPLICLNLNLLRRVLQGLTASSRGGDVKRSGDSVMTYTTLSKEALLFIFSFFICQLYKSLILYRGAFGS